MNGKRAVPDDGELLVMLRRTPEQGMELLMDAYTGLLCAVVKHRLSGSQFVSTDVEDCVADAFSSFYAHLDSFDPSVCSIRSYLCVLAGRCAVDVLRRRAPERMNVSPDDGDEVLEIPDTDLPPDEEAARREFCRQVMQAVERLGPPDADILVRKYCFGQAAEDIASSLGLTVSNVNTRAHRALGKLKKQFGGTGI